MIIYFPIEIQARELPTRLALSLSLIEKGHTVVICDQRQLNTAINQLPPGIIFHKDTSDCNAGKLFEKAKQKNHLTAALDEEGLVYFSEAAYKKSRLGIETLRNTNLLFCWGSAQANIVHQISDLTAKVVISGHPKFELQRNQRKKSEKYILVNTRFGSVNNGLRPGVEEYVKRMRLVDEVKDSEDETFRRLYFDFMTELMNKFLEMISALSNTFPNEQIVIRPHPVESRKIYEELSQKHSNISISPVGKSLEEDLSDAKVVIHNGCSTGIEALAMRKPVLVYEPIKTPDGDMALPNNFGLLVKSQKQLFDRIREINTGRFDWCEIDHRIQKYVSNFASGSPIEIISEAISSLSIKHDETHQLRARYFKDSKVNRLIKILPEKLLFGFLRKRYNAIMYSDNKNPDLDSFELIARLNAINITTQRLENLMVSKLAPKTYLIQKTS